MMRIDDKLLVDLLKEGNDMAFKFIYDQYYNILCRFAYQIINDKCLSEDIVNDIIFYLWENHEIIKFDISLRSYLFKSVRNKCINERKSLKFKSEQQKVYIEDVDYLISIYFDYKSPLGILIEKEKEKEINDCINNLPSACKKVFLLSRYDNLTYQQIANRLNISVNTVKFHIMTALAILRKNLDHYMMIVFLVTTSFYFFKCMI